MQERIYYINGYLTVERDQKEYFIIEKNFTSQGFTAKQRRIFKRLVDGEGLDRECLLSVFKMEYVDRLIEQEIILPKQLDLTSIESRNEAYFYSKGLKGTNAILKKKSVLILGCGGLGTHMAWNMVALGVGTVYLLDYDIVEMSNLNRQIYFDIHDVGYLKTDVLKAKLEKVNPNVKIIAKPMEITSEEVLEREISLCNPDCVVKALDSPACIMEWIDSVCEKYGIRYVSAVMLGSSQLIGPTYHSKENLQFSDFFQTNENRNRERGIAPSLGFVMYQMAGEISEEVFKILTGEGELKYTDKMVLHENIGNRTSTMYHRKKYPAEEQNYYNKLNIAFSFCLLAIYYAGSCFSLNPILIWAIAISYTVLVPAVIAHTEKDAFQFSFILLSEIILFNILFLAGNGLGNMIGAVEWNVIPMLISTLLILLSVINLLVYLLDHFIYITKKLLIRKLYHDRAV